MAAFRIRQESPSIRVHGNGKIGGKGEGLIFLDRAIARRPLHRVEPLASEILATEVYARYRDNGRQLDKESVSHLRQLHASLPQQPVSVRPSEKEENNPLVPTSGMNTSHMLPNNHSDKEVRFGQFLQAIRCCYEQFEMRMLQPGNNGEELMAIVINPIHGFPDSTRAGLVYYPMSSGVADSLCNPVAGRKVGEGFARVVFGHGYGAVLETPDIRAIPVLSIQNPADTGELVNGQRFFFAVDMRKNTTLGGAELETITTLSINMAEGRALSHFGRVPGGLNFGGLIGRNSLGYISGLQAIMEACKAEGTACFQIEFIFNIIDGKGIFHVVQYKQMRDVLAEYIAIPETAGRRVYISTDRVQGHGIVSGLKKAVVISPFLYGKDRYVEVRDKLRELNREMQERTERYVLVCPGRLGSINSEWGIYVNFLDISQAAVIVEYGYDITGSPEVTVTIDELKKLDGGHLEYALYGGMQKDEQIRKMRRLGSQGTHFNTNLFTAGIIYVHIDPTKARFDSWFFDVPEHTGSPIYVKEFDTPVTAYADLPKKKCVII